LPSAIEITPAEYRNPPAAVEIASSKAACNADKQQFPFVHVYTSFRQELNIIQTKHALQQDMQSLAHTQFPAKQVEISLDSFHQPC
jgi:hypothetical protein